MATMPVALGKRLLKVLPLNLCKFMQTYLHCFRGSKLCGNNRNVQSQTLLADSRIETSTVIDNSRSTSKSESGEYNREQETEPPSVIQAMEELLIYCVGHVKQLQLLYDHLIGNNPSVGCIVNYLQKNLCCRNELNIN